MSTVNIGDWEVGLCAEPSVRVGIILPEDRRGRVYFSTGRAGCRVHCDGAETVSLPPGEVAEAIARDDSVELRYPGSSVRGSAIRLSPLHGAPLTMREGICVRDVPAGRGFHWQKAVDEYFPGSIELLSRNGYVLVVNCLRLEDYLAGVITAEMSGQCPGEFLKAQCVVARSWLLAFTEQKHSDEPFDRCNDDCCQRYRGTGDVTPAALEAVRRTRGEVLLTGGGEVLDANYSKCCGGISEEPRFVWGTDKAGIRAVVDAAPGSPDAGLFPPDEDGLRRYLDADWARVSRAYCGPRYVKPEDVQRYLGRVDEPGEYFRWTLSYPRWELEELLRTKLTATANLVRLLDLRVLARGVSGRAVRLAVRWSGADDKEHDTIVESEYEIRRVLHRSFLYSSAFLVRIERDERNLIRTVRLEGAGWGHGVGLCQMGALGMALSGRSYEQICEHYYPAARLERVYD